MGDNEEFEVCDAFKDAGQKVGMEIWRIEKFDPVAVEKSSFGKFYNGDAYICLSTEQRQGSNKLDYSLHFWLGKLCSQDKSGTAALRTVELDSGVLNGSAVQYREVQSHESKLFLSYFKAGGSIQYLEGGAEGGFKTYDPNDYVKRLFQVKGKKNVRVEQVECRCGSLNQGDVFVLDDGPNLYVWIGPYSGSKEKLAGVETAKRLRDGEKGGRAHIHAIEDDWESNPAFFKALGSKDKIIKAAVDDDDDTVRRLDQNTTLYQVSPVENPTDEKWCEVFDVAERPLEQYMLDSDHCFVLDSGYSGIYLWTGKNSTNDFKKKVWNAVGKFLDNRGYPGWISVTRVVDGGETPLFKQYFTSWIDPEIAGGSGDEVQMNGNVADQDYEGAAGIDKKLMHQKSTTAEAWMPDDGSGSYKIWRIENMEPVELAEKARGAFFGEDCYVIQYTYEVNNRENHIIYFWQGLKSTSNDKGASAGYAVKLDDSLGGDAVQVRVVMNKEPAHFMKVFKDRIVIFMGGSSVGYRGARDRPGFDSKASYMFDIRSGEDGGCRAIEVISRGASLNTNGIFIIDAPRKLYIWVGKNHDESSVALAKEMVAFVAPDRSEPEIIFEGEENLKYWDAIGGEEPYYTGPKKSVKGVRIPPRLFQCSMTSGRFTVDEICAFKQEDLDASDVMLLDTFDEIFVWIGKDSREWEKQEAMKTAYQYLNSDPTGRSPDNTIIVCVRQGFEPPQFTGCFHPWNPEMWNSGMSFADIIADVGKENAGINLLEDEAKKYTATYPLDVLQRPEAPEGVDVTKKEKYLSDEDFQQVFGMTKDAFLLVPEWKRNNMRKDRGLF